MSEIINTFHQLCCAKKAGLPYVAICKAILPGRAPRSVIGWAIYVPGTRTDPNGAWYQNGNKWITESKYGGRIEALEAAKEYASKHYGPVTEWKRNRMQEYVDARVAKQFPLRTERRVKQEKTA